ncbi:MAG: type II toxin-antitoxin system VapC family toxin [bacterium]|nr:type II toxin-antitoxin system VapC family toxin [bacterium]
MNYLLDTDVIIEILRKNIIHLIKKLKELSRQGNLICYSPVTKAEIYHGLRPNEENKVANFFSQLECLPVDSEIGEKAGYYLKTYRKSHNLQLGDALIAATAFCKKACLFTLNIRHYPMTEIEFYKQ